MTSRQVDALLFDLGGVVIDVDLDRAFALWAAHAGCDKELLAPRFAVNDVIVRHEIGAIDDQRFFADLCGALGVEMSFDQFIAGWNAILVGEMPGIVALLERMAGQLPLYAFSNTNRIHELVWSRRFADVLRHFRKIFVSSAMGMRKPNADAFDFVVREIGVPAHRIAFFDDVLENVDGAMARGLRAFQVRSTAEIEKAIEGLIPQGLFRI
jgi:FMN phosphatase YigB (HAD superfamily)